MKNLPDVIRKLIAHHDIWICGSSAETFPLLTNNNLDIAVPFTEWSKVALLIPETATPTNLGGWRFHKGNVSIDIWPTSLEELVSISSVKCLYSPKRGLRLNISHEPFLP